MGCCTGRGPAWPMKEINCCEKHQPEDTPKISHPPRSHGGVIDWETDGAVEVAVWEAPSLNHIKF